MHVEVEKAPEYLIKKLMALPHKSQNYRQT